jgi:predicted butyrate kinase (DUF1464 family)
MTPTPKYLSDILTSSKKTDGKDPTKDFYEISVNISDARKVWLNVSTPDVKNAENRTQLQVIVKDNASKKMMTMIGTVLVPSGYVLPVFNGALITNKTIIFRAADPISVWFEAKLDN